MQGNETHGYEDPLQNTPLGCTLSASVHLANSQYDRNLSAKILSAPSDVLLAAVELTQSGELFHHVWVSLGRAVNGFLIGGSIGFILGIVNGLFRTSEMLIDTSVQMLRNIPHLALIPLSHSLVWNRGRSKSLPRCIRCTLPNLH